MTQSEGRADERAKPLRPAAQPARRGAVAAGLIAAAIAALALFDARGLPLGTAQHPGPAAAPDVLAALLFMLGIIVAIEGWLRPRTDGGE